MEKKLLLKIDDTRFYEDGTYDCFHWEGRGYAPSFWTIDDQERLMWKHKHGDDFFKEWESNDSKKMGKLLLNALTDKLLSGE